MSYVVKLSLFHSLYCFLDCYFSSLLFSPFLSFFHCFPHSIFSFFLFLSLNYSLYRDFVRGSRRSRCVDGACAGACILEKVGRDHMTASEKVSGDPITHASEKVSCDLMTHASEQGHMHYIVAPSEPKN